MYTRLGSQSPGWLATTGTWGAAECEILNWGVSILSRKPPVKFVGWIIYIRKNCAGWNQGYDIPCRFGRVFIERNVMVWVTSPTGCYRKGRCSWLWWLLSKSNFRLKSKIGLPKRVVKYATTLLAINPTKCLRSGIFTHFAWKKTANRPLK